MLNEGFESVHGDQPAVEAFLFVSVDGSCIDLDGWKCLRKLYSHGAAAGRGKGTKRQQRMVMLYFLACLFYAYEAPLGLSGETTVALAFGGASASR